jgi:hypothetical protein
MSLRLQFLEFDDTLAAHGVPPLTPWWRKGIGSWLDRYEREHVLELWACAGRGSSKSTAIYKLAAFFAVHGDFRVPPGERHFAIVLSRLKEEASKATPIIAAWLRLLSIPHHVAGDVIELDDLPRGIRVVAASVAATSGWRAFFVAKDERAKWAYDGAEMLDADEVDTSATSMTATHALAPVVTVGSAWGMAGSFFETITAGSDSSRVVLGPVPTWIAAPHISRESTEKKERDPRRWAREYACQFSATALGCFATEDIEAAFEPRASGTICSDTVVIIDASSGQKDSFTYGLVHWEQPGPDDGRSVLDWGTARDLEPPPPPKPAGPPFLRFAPVVGIGPAEAGRLKADGVVRKVAALARTHRAVVVGDQRDAWTLSSLFRSEKVRFVERTWTSANKAPAVELVRHWLREGVLSLPPDATQMRDELLAFEERIEPKSGQFTFGGRGKHDDFVSLLITAALVVLEGGLRHRVPRPPRPGGGSSGGTPPPVPHDDGSFFGGGAHQPGTVGWG